ncbi:MAG: hypothetical protein EHM23_04245 [Acidobacteria bacterium]|nr:MAG: hypothetical protein EHM23_04245 [Acidobacteriota bacterium]
MIDPSRTWERLHSTTLWLPALARLPQIVMLAVLISVWAGVPTGLKIAFWFVFLPATVFHVLRFLTFEFEITASEIFIREGLLWRQERRIPFSRVQDVKIQQGLVHRMFGLAKVELTTAGSEKREVSLELITRDRADELRRAITRQADRRVAGVPDSVEPIGTTLARLTLPQLLLGAATSRMAATLAALIGVILYFKTALYLGSTFIGEHFQDFDRYSNWGESFIPFRGTALGPIIRFFWDDTLGKSIVLILFGFFFSLIRYIVRYGRYQLTQTGDVLTKTHGILRLGSSSLARRRVQALKVEEGLLRRWFGLCDVWVDSGGDRAKVDDEKKREPFVPVMDAAQAYSLVRDVLDHLDNPQPAWKRVSPKAVMRGTKILWLILVSLMIVNAVPFGWFTLVFLPGFPLAYFLNVKWYRNRGYWVDDHYLISRRGWFNRETLYLPIHVVQNVSLTESPFDRRLGLATLAVDTAGQTNTGGGTAIRNLPLEEAIRLQSLLTLGARTAPARRKSVPGPVIQQEAP